MITRPGTYQQWLDCLERLEQQPWDKEALALARQGTYTGTPSEAFLTRLSEAVSVMLSRCTQRFLRDLDRALADGDPDMASLLAVRFQAQLRNCFFYRELPFLKASYVRTLDQGFEAQLEAFWKDFLSKLKALEKETMDPQIEDMTMELRRIRIISVQSEAKI